MIFMATLTLHMSLNFNKLVSAYDDFTKKRSCLALKFIQTRSSSSLSTTRRDTSVEFMHGNGLKWNVLVDKHEILMGDQKKRKRVVVVRVNRGFDFNGGGGGGGRDNSNTIRILGNLALAIGLTYLSMTGQLGWVLDAIVSVWLLAVILPIAGLGAFLWFVGQDIVQDSCPNCGNDFQIFKSSLRDGVQFCPFCTQPFSVQGNKFVKESTKFSNQSSKFRQAFNGASPRSERGKSYSSTVVDIEAEVKDVD